MALGLAIIFGQMGVINMAHGEFMILGAYVTFLTSRLFTTYMPSLFGGYFFVAIVLAFCASGLAGMLVEWAADPPSVSPPARHPAGDLGPEPDPAAGLSLHLRRAREVGVDQPDWMMGAANLSDTIQIPINGMIVISLTTLIAIGVYLLIFRLGWGKQVRAVMQNRAMAGAVGIDTERVDRLTFGIGCGIAGVAGSAFTMIGSTSPTAGQLYIVDAFLVVVFGGAGSLIGTIASAFTISQARSTLEFFLSGSMAQVIVLLTVVGILMLRPQGLFVLKVRR